MIPSALRKVDEKWIINDYIQDSEFSLCCTLPPKEYYELGLITEKEYDSLGNNGILMGFKNKNLESINENLHSDYVSNKNDIYFKREVYALLKFLNRADKSGLKVPINKRIRELIHLTSDYGAKIHFHSWPDKDYFELMALAQHYGLPTRLLDWSYDYKVALYFAVRDILTDKNEDVDGVLWAFNYRKFDDAYKTQYKARFKFPLHFYRPAYESNPNLSAQKGLFTILENTFQDDVDMKPFDEIIIDFLEKSKKEYFGNVVYELNDRSTLNLNNDEKLFYKFIIPSNLKAKLLKELYLEDYSEEYLFPGYSGVTKAIRNKTKLDEFLK